MLEGACLTKEASGMIDTWFLLYPWPAPSTLGHSAAGKSLKPTFSFLLSLSTAQHLAQLRVTRVQVHMRSLFFYLSSVAATSGPCHHCWDPCYHTRSRKFLLFPFSWTPRVMAPPFPCWGKIGKPLLTKSHLYDPWRDRTISGYHFWPQIWASPN